MFYNIAMDLQTMSLEQLKAKATELDIPYVEDVRADELVVAISTLLGPESANKPL